MKGEYIFGATGVEGFPQNKLQLSNYLDLLKENEGNSSVAQASYKEFKNLPFRCDSDRTQYNQAGRIKTMYFVQQTMSFTY